MIPTMFEFFISYYVIYAFKASLLQQFKVQVIKHT